MTHREWAAATRDGGVGTAGFVREFDLWDEERTEAAKQIEAELGGVDLVRIAFCDPHGLARSKTVPAQVFRAVLRNGMDFSPGPFVFDTGHAIAVDFLGDGSDVRVAEISGAGDFVVVPDPLTFQPLSGTGPRIAWVLGEEHLRGGAAHPLSARRVLRNVVERYREHGLDPVIGLEIEWYLTRLLDERPGNEGNGFGTQGPAPAVAAMNAGYQFNLDSIYDTVAPVTDPLAMTLLGLGLPLRTMEHESGPGQIETTFQPMRALDAADAMLLFRTLTKQYCARRGYHASFMTLPGIEGFDSSGWHLHQSVADRQTGANVFDDRNGDGNGDGRKTAGLSAQGRAYLGGLLAAARELCLLSVPTVNGYRRFDERFTLSPDSADWAVENRTVMARVVGSGPSLHLENRVGEPCANPYLLMAAQLSAGFEGLRAASEVAGQHASGQKLPTSLREALAAFRDGERARGLLGEPLTACLIRMKESEADRFEAWGEQHPSAADGVTEWEQREYFRCY